MRVDETLKAECIASLERVPDGPIATPSFTLEQAELAERCEPAKTRAEQWAEHKRDDRQIDLWEE